MWCLRSRVQVRAVLAPEGHRIRGAVVPVAGSDVVVGGLVLHVDAVTPRLTVEVARAPPGALRVGR